MNKVILGIDYNNNVFGSYYGEKLINSKNMNVNAIKGFFFKIKMLKDIFNPDYIILANDLSRSRTFRRKLYKNYKAQRKPMDPDIFNQMQYISQICTLLGYPFINNELYEADDILGMISKYASENGMTMVISSSDKDLYQLLNDFTFIYSPKQKEMIDKLWLYEKYKLTPEQWIELKILQGDRSDNIPGIPGIGEVTALKLMQEFGSIDGIYSHMGYHKPTLRQTLIDGKDVIPLTRDLVTIVTDYTKINFNGNMLNRNQIFYQEVYDVLEELELNSLFNIMNYSLFKDKEEEVNDRK